MRLDYTVMISGCSLTVAKDPDAERNYHFNKAMLALFKSGCRRIRSARPLRPRNGDAEKYILSGYLER